MATLKVPVSPSDHIQGIEKAAITLVEYGDYECPHCGIAYPIVKKLQKHFGARLRFVYRNYPLKEIHSYAESAAESAEFAAVHNRFWEMHDGIFEDQEAIGLPLFLAIAKSLRLSEQGLREALVNGIYEPRVKEDFLGGVRSGVNGTPTFFINGHRYEGSLEIEELAAAIEGQASKD